jgi:hypothetical protein
MKLPERKFKPPVSDEKFVERQLAVIDKDVSKVAPPEDAHELAAMALSPIERPAAIQQLLAKATLKASTLILSKEEQKQLRVDFPDGDFQRGAGGDTNLIYLEHSAIRNRLSDVIGFGQWSFEIIRSWQEDFSAGNPPKPAVRVYVEGMLLIRGAKVGVAIGDGNYFKANAKGNYGDAYESAKTAALRRCAKDFGIGLQAFSKDWCENWKAKYKGFDRPTK